MISADSIRVVHPLFQTESDGSIPISALQLHIVKTNATIALKYNKLWHSRLPDLLGPQPSLNFAAISDNVYYAVAMWSNPVARLLPQHEWLELRRMAIANDAPKNTASRMIAIMTRWIKKNMPQITTLMSYQDTEVHQGTIYKASGWDAVATNKYSQWHPTRKWHPEQQTVALKTRWQKTIRAADYRTKGR